MAQDLTGNDTLAPSALQTGRDVPRVEGREKVLGRVRYTGDLALPRMAHAVLVQATIACGCVSTIDREQALQQPGILDILTPDNINALAELPETMTQDLPAERRPPLADWRVHYVGQHVALVVGETLLEAEHAASRLRFTYVREPAVLHAAAALHAAVPAKEAGQVRAGVYYPDHFTRLESEKLQSTRGRVPAGGEAKAGVAMAYRTPVTHHNPIESSATLAAWQGDELTLHDTTRWLLGSRGTIAAYLRMPEEKVRVHCAFLGGAFGAKGFLWQHVVLAAVAARRLGRPVKLVLTRAQMFTSTGHRPETLQQVLLAADGQQRLLSVEHHTLSETSTVAQYTEPAGLHSRNLYASPHAAISHAVARIHRATPVFMRAPGEAPGLYALESAMDELAYSMKPALDPVTLRVRNHALRDQDGDKPYAAKHLLTCYAEGARRFGWQHRPAAPRSLLRDGLLTGYGMATATYPGRRMPAAAAATLGADGCLTVRVATHELGNGVRTVLTQIAADACGLALRQVQVLTGDSDFAEAPYTGASQTTATVGPAVQAACALLRQKLVQHAVEHRQSPFFGITPAAMRLDEGRLTDGSINASVARVLCGQALEAEARTQPPEDMEARTHQSFGAHFVEVIVDEALGSVRVVRWGGRLQWRPNPEPAARQGADCRRNFVRYWDGAA